MSLIHPINQGYFCQITLLEVYRWLLLSMVAYLLAYWIYLLDSSSLCLDWSKVAHLTLEMLLPHLSYIGELF